MKGICEQVQSQLSKFKNEAVYKFDVFGQLPSFSVLNRDKFTSTIGFIISVIFEIGMLFYLVNEVNSMITYSKPSIYQTEIQVIETNPYYLYNENFTLAVSVSNRFSEPLIGQNQYFFLNISQCIRTRAKDQITGNVIVVLNCTDLPIEPCNMTHFTTAAQKDYFSRARFGAMQCINREYLRNNPPKLQGQFNALVHSYLSISLSVCKNNSEFNGCAPQEQIDEILQTGHYVAYYSDFLSKLERPGEVYEEIINYQFSGFSLSTSKLITQTYRIIETQTDEGLIWEENSIQTNLQFKDWNEIQDFYNQQYLVTHYIMLDYKQTNNIRTYIKIQTVIARIGGVLQIFILLFAKILRPLINNLMNFEIAHSLYRLEEISDQQCIQPGSNKLILTDREQQHSPIQLDSIQLSKWNSEQSIKRKKSCCETLFIVLGFNQKQNEVFQKAKKKIQKNLDIVTILQKLQDIDLIKKVVFTKEQQEILKILPKPLITSTSTNGKKQHTDSQQLVKTPKNMSSLLLHLKKNKQSQISQNMNMVISKSFIDDQLYNYIEQYFVSQNSKKEMSQEVEIGLDEIKEPLPQQPK